MKGIKLILSGVLILIINTITNGQILNNLKNNQQTFNMPETSIKVNKEYDKDSNLVRYDSTYTYYYSGTDTVFSSNFLDEFKRNFYLQHSYSLNPLLNGPFINDSLFKSNFYKKEEDYFTEHVKKSIKEMMKVFDDMESLDKDVFSDKIPEENK